MIQSLSISNYALIEKLHIDFSSGFTIITGETGAGKSILLGALGLVLGKRADLSALQNMEDKCVIEASFQIAAYQLQDFFETHDLDYDDLTIIRREVLPSGKSRAFINDTPVNLQDLQSLGAFLIDIHSQHQTMELSESSYQFQVLDIVVGNFDLLQTYRAQLEQHRRNEKALIAAQESLQSLRREEDYATFLLDELQSLNLKAIRPSEVEQEFEQLSNVELIREQLGKALQIGLDEQYGVLQLLLGMRSAVHKVSSFSQPLQQLFERMDSIYIDLKDCAAEIEERLAELSDDPEKMAKLGEILQKLNDLQKKHQVASVEELLQVQDKLSSQVHGIAEIENHIVILQAQIETTRQQLDQLASQLHENRANGIPSLIKQWENLCAELGMPHARFQIDLKPISTYLENGKEEIAFYFSANKGGEVGLLRKTASGGELSRIMLATKAILAEHSDLPSIIFDEIDTGVSGEMANRMSAIMKRMSTRMQVIAITHLPQIAAKGDRHFKVQKNIRDDRTLTEIAVLSKDERVLEIAQMLSGVEISESAVNHARTLLN